MRKHTAILALLLHLAVAAPGESTNGGKPAQPSTVADSEVPGGGAVRARDDTKRAPSLEVTNPKKSTILSPELVQSILEGHNVPRAAEPAVNMPPLVWNASLAQIAQRWTDACKFAHQPRRVRRWGENIAAVGNTRSKDTQISAMLKEWVAEKKFNKRGTFEECCSFRANSCCHYTQVVWDRSTQLGCGYTECSTLNYGGEMMRDIAYLACYYTPPGNSPVVTYDWKPYEPVPEGGTKPESGTPTP